MWQNGVAFVQVDSVFHYFAAVETRTAKQLRSGNHLPVGINILEGWWHSLSTF